MCHTFPSIANFELCEPVENNYPLLKTLVSRLTSKRSQAGNLSTSVIALDSRGSPRVKGSLLFAVTLFGNQINI